MKKRKKKQNKVKEVIMFGQELLMDVYDCDVTLFNRKDLTRYFIELCKLIDMVRADLHFWDYTGATTEELAEVPPHLLGTSAVQFIMTSQIAIHTLDVHKAIFIDVFSCKDYDAEVVTKFTESFFKGKIGKAVLIERGRRL